MIKFYAKLQQNTLKQQSFSKFTSKHQLLKNTLNRKGTDSLSSPLRISEYIAGKLISISVKKRKLCVWHHTMNIKLRKRKFKSRLRKFTIKPLIHIEVQRPIVGSMSPGPDNNIDTTVC